MIAPPRRPPGNESGQYIGKEKYRDEKGLLNIISMQR